MLFIVRVTNTALLLVIFILTLDRTVLPIEICGLDENNKKLVAVQNLDKNVESNGCSKPSFIQVSGEEDFTYCCDRHDACYATCGAPKAFCDLEFKKCMKKMCKSLFRQNRDCDKAADTYAMGTMIFGEVGFSDSQRDFCVCVPSTEVQTHYRKLLTSFYGKYAPEKTVDIDAVLNNPKYTKQTPEGGPNSYYKLYFGLVSKYDQAIAHIEGRVGKTIARPRSKEEL